MRTQVQIQNAVTNATIWLKLSLQCLCQGWCLILPVQNYQTRARLQLNQLHSGKSCTFVWATQQKSFLLSKLNKEWEFILVL